MYSHKIDYKIYGDDLQAVEIELDPQETVVAEAGGMKEEKVPIIIISTTRRDLVVFDNMVSPHRRLYEPPLNTSITGRTEQYHS